METTIVSSADLPRLRARRSRNAAPPVPIFEEFGATVAESRPLCQAPVAGIGRFIGDNRLMVQRALYVVPGLLTWLAVSALFWGPLANPWALALLVLGFDLWWFTRAFNGAFYGLQGYWRIRSMGKIDWRAEYARALDDGKVLLPWEEMHHIAVIPNYKEHLEKLRATVKALALQPDASWQLTLVLAMEEREPEAVEKAKLLEEEFRDSFAHLLCTFHPDGIPGEVPGKSSNEAWAVREAKRLLVDQLGYDLSAITVTICDADSILHKNYFSCLSYKFATDPKRHARFWQAPIFLHNNVWQVPMPIRLVSVLSSINFLGDLAKGGALVFPQSTYTLSLKLADEVGYWDPDVIPEDWHMFLKCFFHARGEVSTDAIFLPIGADAVRSTTYWKSLMSRYKQAKRHAWGAEDVAYAATECLVHPEIPRRVRWRYLWAVLENHWVWATHWFVLTLGGFVPTLLAPQLNEILPSFGLSPLVSLLLSACLGPFLVVIAIDALLRPSPPPGYKWWFVPLSHLQWFLLPVTSAIFATIPALHAQTELMLGVGRTYEVTEKV